MSRNVHVELAGERTDTLDGLPDYRGSPLRHLGLRRRPPLTAPAGASPPAGGPAPLRRFRAPGVGLGLPELQQRPARARPEVAAAGDRGARAIVAGMSGEGVLRVGNGGYEWPVRRGPRIPLRGRQFPSDPAERLAVRGQDALPAASGGGALRVPDPAPAVREDLLGLAGWRPTTTGSGREISRSCSGGRTVGRNPKPERHRYVTLRFDFSEILKAPATLEREFEAYCEIELEDTLECHPGPVPGGGAAPHPVPAVHVQPARGALPLHRAPRHPRLRAD